MARSEVANYIINCFQKLNTKQIEKLSDIASDVALVSLASVVLPALLDKFKIVSVVLGLLITIFLWSGSLWLKK